MPSFLHQPARACGIDFGTSNSTAGWFCPGQDTVLKLENGRQTLPSVVFFNAETDSTSFGRAALADYLDGYEGRLMRSLKSLLGSALIDEQTEVNGFSLSFRDLLTRFIVEIKRCAELSAGREFDTVVLGRPVHFVDDNAKADRLAELTLAEIVRDAGFRELSFQLEPIAAAFHYEQSISSEELVLIADIGGGTSDFSIVRLSPQRAELTDRRGDLLACAGVHIGGTDFDKYLSLSGVMPLLGYSSRLKNNAEVPSSYYFNFATWHTINFNYTRKIQRELQDVYHDAREKDKLSRLLSLVDKREGHWLAMQIEAAKIELSNQSETHIRLDRIEEGLLSLMNRDSLDASIGHLVERVQQTVVRLLNDAGLHADQIDTVFFTGGSSGVPLLRHGIAALLPKSRCVEGDLFGSIGAGLAVEAAKRYG